MFRGEPLAGLPGPLAELERLRLVERRVAIVQRKVEWQLRLGQDAEAVDELFALSAAHPLNEPLAAMLMRALYRDGRQAGALEHRQRVGLPTVPVQRPHQHRGQRLVEGVRADRANSSSTASAS